MKRTEELDLSHQEGSWLWLGHDQKLYWSRTPLRNGDARMCEPAHLARMAPTIRYAILSARDDDATARQLWRDTDVTVIVAVTKRGWAMGFAIHADRRLSLDGMCAVAPVGPAWNVYPGGPWPVVVALGWRDVLAVLDEAVGRSP